MTFEFTTKVFLPKDRSQEQFFLEDKKLFPSYGKISLNKKELVRITQAYIKEWCPMDERKDYHYMMCDIAEKVTGRDPRGGASSSIANIAKFDKKQDECLEKIMPNFHEVFFKGEGLPISVYVYYSPETHKTLYDWLWKTPNHEEI